MLFALQPGVASDDWGGSFLVLGFARCSFTLLVGVFIARGKAHLCLVTLRELWDNCRGNVGPARFPIWRMGRLSGADGVCMPSRRNFLPPPLVSISLQPGNRNPLWNSVPRECVCVGGGVGPPKPKQNDVYAVVREFSRSVKVQLRASSPYLLCYT